MNNDRHVCNNPRQIVDQRQEYNPEFETMRYLFSPFEQQGMQSLPPTWKRAEEVIIEEYDLTEEHASWYDARGKPDEYIEIKSCVCEYQNEQVGEFLIWDNQWRKISGQGKFGLLVYSPETYSIIATCMIRPYSIGENGTSRYRNHPTMGYRRLWHVPWPDVIPLDGVETAREYFKRYYSEEEVEDTFILEYGQ